MRVTWSASAWRLSPKMLKLTTPSLSRPPPPPNLACFLCFLLASSCPCLVFSPCVFFSGLGLRRLVAHVLLLPVLHLPDAQRDAAPREDERCPGLEHRVPLRPTVYPPAPAPAPRCTPLPPRTPPPLSRPNSVLRPLSRPPTLVYNILSRARLPSLIAIVLLVAGSDGGDSKYLRAYG